MIIKKYVFGWFFFDVFAFFPLAYLRFNSVYLDGGNDNFKNFI